MNKILSIPFFWRRLSQNQKLYFFHLAVWRILVITIPLVTLRHQKTTLSSGLVYLTGMLNDWLDTLKRNIQQKCNFVKFQKGAWTRRELNPVDLGYQANLANLPSPHQINCSKYEIHQS